MHRGGKLVNGDGVQAGQYIAGVGLGRGDGVWVQNFDICFSVGSDEESDWWGEHRTSVRNLSGWQMRRCSGCCLQYRDDGDEE